MWAHYGLDADSGNDETSWKYLCLFMFTVCAGCDE